MLHTGSTVLPYVILVLALLGCQSSSPVGGRPDASQFWPGQTVPADRPTGGGNQNQGSNPGGDPIPTAPQPGGQGGTAPAVAPSAGAPGVNAPVASPDRAYIDTVVPLLTNIVKILTDAGTMAAKPDLKSYAAAQKDAIAQDLAALKALRNSWFPGQATAQASADDISYLTDRSIVDQADYDWMAADALQWHYQDVIDASTQSMSSLKPELQPIAQRLQDLFQKDKPQLNTWAGTWSAATGESGSGQ